MAFLATYIWVRKSHKATRETCTLQQVQVFHCKQCSHKDSASFHMQGLLSSKQSVNIEYMHMEHRKSSSSMWEPGILMKEMNHNPMKTTQVLNKCWEKTNGRKGWQQRRDWRREKLKTRKSTKHTMWMTTTNVLYLATDDGKTKTMWWWVINWCKHMKDQATHTKINILRQRCWLQPVGNKSARSLTIDSSTNAMTCSTNEMIWTFKSYELTQMGSYNNI